MDPEGFEPSFHGLKVRSVTVTPQIHLVGRSGVGPDSSGLQPDAFTGLAFFPLCGTSGSAEFSCRPGKEVLHGVPVSLQGFLLAPSAGIEPAFSD